MAEDAALKQKQSSESDQRKNLTPGTWNRNRHEPLALTIGTGKSWGEKPKVKIRGEHVVMAGTVCQLFARRGDGICFPLRPRRRPLVLLIGWCASNFRQKQSSCPAGNWYSGGSKTAGAAIWGAAHPANLPLCKKFHPWRAVRVLLY